ncbi:hypothetical protein NDAWWUGD_CDS0134 [Salmonella phage SeKF_80]
MSIATSRALTERLIILPLCCWGGNHSASLA